MQTVPAAGSSRLADGGGSKETLMTPSNALHALVVQTTTDPPYPRITSLDAATRATAANFPASASRPTAPLRTGLLVLRREGRVALLPLDDQGLRIPS